MGLYIFLLTLILMKYSFKYLFFAGIFFAIPNVAFWIPSRYILFLEKEDLNEILDETLKGWKWARF